MSLRGRLVIALLALVAAGLAISDVATYKTLERFLVRRVDQQLATVGRGALGGFPRFEDRPPGGPVPQGFGRAELYGQVRDATGRVIRTFNSRAAETSTPAIPTRLPRPPAAPTAQGGQLRGVNLTVGSVRSGPKWRVRVVAVPGTQDTLAVALPLRDVSNTLHDLVLIELAVSGAVLLAAAGLAIWLVRLGLRPLDDIETTAGAIAAGDLSRRVPEGSARSEVGRLAAALNAMLSQIEGAFAERRASEDRLRRFVADASHELRTPLTSIRGYAELFRRGADHRPDDLAKTMRRIEDEATRMGILVDDLLLLARLDQGRPLLRDPVDLTRVVREATEAALIVDASHPLALEVNGAVTVLGDKARLRQVADNLLANVRTHTPPWTPATVRVGSENGTAILEVTDQGPGLPPEQAARIFERFYRADQGRSRDQGGSGLGLAIVDSIVTSLGGSASVVSEPGQGSTFRVELPLSNPPATGARP